MFKAIVIVSLIFFLFIAYNSCNNDLVGPKQDIPGRRDYIWSIDTLNYPYDTMYRIWGSSPTDIWTTSTGFWDKSISHFDGEGWSSYGISGIIVPNAIYGFSSNNIFIGAENGRIWRFNGSGWTQFGELSKDGHSDIVFDNIWGESANDFYVFGAYLDDKYLYNNSVIAHFANTKWILLNTEGLTGIVENLYKNDRNQKIYLKTLKWNNGTTYDSIFIYEYYNKIYNKIYSSTWDYEQAGSISLINSEVYFVLGRKIAKRINNQFQIILNIQNPKFYNTIWGRNSKDIFLVMTDGLAHYNGSDIEYLFYFNKTPRTQIFGATLFENEVFFLVYEFQTNLNLIYHGVLKKGG